MKHIPYCFANEAHTVNPKLGTVLVLYRIGLAIGYKLTIGYG
jgi:hypothetical protein